jgi:N-acetylneuraminic acid mutarotase
MTKLVATAAILLIAAVSFPGSWSNGPSLPVARSEVAVATLGDSTYVIGGYANGNVDQTRVDVFIPVPIRRADVILKGWLPGVALPRGLNHVGAVGYNGKVYTFGGFSAQNNDAVSDANVYDPSTGKWSPIAPLPRALGSVSVAVLGDKIHLVGGRDVHSVPAHLVYDPAANRYSTLAPLPIGRDHMGLVAYGSKLYAIGGRIDTPAHNTSYVDIYDPKTNAWKAGAPMPTARSGMAVAVCHDSIFAIGGEQSGMTEAFRTNEGYDPATNRWSEYAPLPEGRHGTGAAVIAEELYVPAGAPVPGGSRQSDTLLIFTP